MSSDTTRIEVQALTRAVPTLSTDGQALQNFTSVTVVAVAPTGQTLSGVGTLQCWYYDPVVALWARIPALDLALTGATTQAFAWPAMPVIGPRNARVLWTTSGVTISSGTTVTVYQLGFVPDLEDVY